MATFTLSLDCEGLWGMADMPRVIDGGQINDASLADAYRTVLDTLSAHEVKATAAFVSTFAVSSDVLMEVSPSLRELASYVPQWFAAPLRALERRHLNGWSGHAFHDALRAAGHEMGWHGATHLALHDGTPSAAVDLELKLAGQLFTALGYAPTSVVYPRNLVGHLSALRRAGFTTYRAAPATSLIGRVKSLGHELNVLDRRVSEQARQHGDWSVSPSGHFLNWPSGVRALIPVPVTVLRWKSMLRAAVETNGYVHMWFHPHNLITAPAMKIAFTEIMREVGMLVRRGELKNVTMSETAALTGGRRVA